MLNFRNSHQIALQQHRVVVTGAGIVSSMGLGWKTNAEGLRSGRQALKELSVFDSSRQRVQRAGEVNLPSTMPTTCKTEGVIRHWDRPTQMLIHAAHEAVNQAGGSQLFKEDTAVWLGTSAGAMQVGQTYYLQRVRSPECWRGVRRMVYQYQPATQARFMLSSLGLSVPVQIISNACASGANAIGEAFHQVKFGHRRRALAGGYDALAQMVFAGFDTLQALSTTQPRPFDAQRDGLAIGEGAAILTLERLEDALARKVEILAEVVGYGVATDLHHLTQPHPQGDAALASMQAACAEAQLRPEQIQYINSHGTGTPLNDVAEGSAINRWAGASVAPQIMVSSTKAAIGHLLGGAGAVETVICLMTLRDGFIAPTLGVREIDPICEFDLVCEPREINVDCVLTNSFGFGGANASLILKKVSS